MEDEVGRAEVARKGCPYLTTKQAAFHLGLSSRTLEAMRRTGKGPGFRRHGALVRYHIDELDGWSRGSGQEADHG